jgi:hypothetical protein
MSIFITSPINKPVNVTATLQAGGALLANTTYYVRVAAKSFNTYPAYSTPSTQCLWSLGSVEISFTTTTTQKSALISWNVVIGAACYNVYCSKVSGEYFNCRFGNGNNMTTVTNSYTIIAEPSASAGINDSFAIPSTDKIPGNINRETANIFISITGTETIDSIYTGIVGAGYSDYVFYDGFKFVLKGGIDITSTITSQLIIENKFIQILQGCIRNGNPKCVMTFGSIHQTQKHPYYGCIIALSYESSMFTDNIKMYNTLISGNLHTGRQYLWQNLAYLRHPSGGNHEAIDILTENIGFAGNGLATSLPFHNLTINTSIYGYWDGISIGCTLYVAAVFIHGYTPSFKEWTFDSPSHISQGWAAGIPVYFYDCIFKRNGVKLEQNLPIISYTGTTPVNRDYIVCNSVLFKVINSNGEGISGVSIKLINSLRNVVFDQITGASGDTLIAYIEHTKMDWNGRVGNGYEYNNIVSYNPFQLIISKKGYIEQRMVIVINNKIYWTIFLDEEDMSEDSELVDLNITDCSNPDVSDGSIEVQASGNGILAYSLEKL